MTDYEKNMLIILKDIFHSGEMPSELCEPIAWDFVMKTAAKQNLLPLIYDAASKYPDFDAFEQQSPQFLSIGVSAISKQMRKNTAFLALYGEFLKDGLAPITMKGIICRTLYGEKGDLRPSGDEDILIEKKDFKKAAAVLERCGYETTDVPDRGLELIQEVSFHNKERGLTVELHLNLFGTTSASRDKMNDWFRNVFQSEETVVIDGVPVRTMTPTDHFLFLVFHAFKHFTNKGFGVRLMLDILLFVEKYATRIDWDYVTKGLDDVNARAFLADLVAIGNTYLGFKLSQHYQSVCPDALLDDMFRMGTFGNATSADRTAGRILFNTLQKKEQGGKVFGNKIARYFRLLFPSWKTWTSGKPYLKDKPWMVVPEWFWRLGRYMRGETATSDIKVLDKSWKIAADRMELLKKYGML